MYIHPCMYQSVISLSLSQLSPNPLLPLPPHLLTPPPPPPAGGMPLPLILFVSTAWATSPLRERGVSSPLSERGVSSMTALPQGVSPATPLPQILTLRGGSNSRSSPRGGYSSSTLPPIITSAPAALDAVDSALFHAEDVLRRLRRRVRECSPRDVNAAPSTLDAALGGAACGYLTGLIVVGDPKTMAVAGSSLRSTHSPMPSPRRHICCFLNQCITPIIVY